MKKNHFYNAVYLIIIFETCLAILGKYILFADGSYMTLQISQIQNYFINTVEWNRALSYIATQWLPVAISNTANPSLKYIVYAYGISCVVPACIISILSLKKLQNQKYSISLHAFFPILFGSNILIGVSTSFIASSIYLFIIAVMLEKSEKEVSSNFSTSVIIAISSLLGDSYFLFAPVFSIIAFSLFLASRNVKQFLTILGGILLGTLINILNLMQRQRDVTIGRATNNALNLEFIMQNTNMILLILAASIFLLKVEFRYLNFIKMFAIMIIIVNVVRFGIPNGHTYFNSRYVLSLGICMIVGIGTLIPRVNKEKYLTLDRFQFAILSFGIVYSQMLLFHDFGQFINKMEDSVKTCSGVVKYTEIDWNQAEESFVWDYTSPSLSRILWSNQNSCLIENANTEIWQPFVPTVEDPLNRKLFW
jgi:hypothetical protein